MKILSNKEYEELKASVDRWYNNYEQCHNDLKKLQDWILRMLEAKGYEINKVPYVVEKQFIRKEYFATLDYTIQEMTTVIIPELRICQSRTNHHKIGDEK